MKRKKRISNKNNGKPKRLPVIWLVVFGVILLLFAAFIIIGIKAGEYAESHAVTQNQIYYSTYTEDVI